MKVPQQLKSRKFWLAVFGYLITTGMAVQVYLSQLPAGSKLLSATVLFGLANVLLGVWMRIEERLDAQRLAQQGGAVLTTEDPVETIDTDTETPPGTGARPLATGRELKTDQ